MTADTHKEMSSIDRMRIKTFRMVFSESSLLFDEEILKLLYSLECAGQLTDNNIKQLLDSYFEELDAAAWS